MSDPIRLLWTGGWDSTYRLLILALVEDREVQPIYVIDPGRSSWPIELEAMQNIRAAISRRSAEAASHIRETIVVKLESIQPIPHITAAYLELKSQGRLGKQYEWLARLADERGWNGLELGAHRTDRVAVWAAHPFFAAFRFPLLDISKKEMRRRADKFGFLDILASTWFCHTPDARGRPCGMCRPCDFTYEQGLWWRLPWRANLLQAKKRFKERLKRAG